MNGFTLVVLLLLRGALTQIKEFSKKKDLRPSAAPFANYIKDLRFL